MDCVTLLHVEIESYSGPLDLLLQLIRKNRLKIEEIPIAEITAAYLARMEAGTGMDPESAGDFLVLASELIYIKSRMLLPKKEDEDEIDPREELVKRLKLYEVFQDVASALSDQEQANAGRILKLAEDLTSFQSEPLELKGDLEALTRSFVRLLQKKTQQEEKDVSGDDFIRSEPFELSVAMNEIRNRVGFEPVAMQDLIRTHRIGEWIAIFIATLELIKTKWICVSVEKDLIFLRRRELG